jgi:glycosyltransferase involved in cell wall biosynthesis
VPPVPVPYREPLFTALARRPSLVLRVIYQAGRVAAWDQNAGWFPVEHEYDAVVLRSRQRGRVERTPLIVPVGLGAALDQFGAECVVVSEFGPAALQALAWCARRRRPLVILTEVTCAGAEQLPGWQRALHRAVASRAAGFIAVSDAARERLIALGADPRAVEVSVQSADLGPLLAIARGEVTERGGPLRLLTVCRLIGDKNVGALLEALARTGLSSAQVALTVVGSGPLEADLRERARRLGLDVEFAGWVAPAELPERYAAAGAFALVSTVEPFGVAVREAAAAGLAMICTRVAGAAGDIAIDGETALLVDPYDVDDIARALCALCRDGALRARLGAAARARVAERGLERDVDAFERAALRAAR